MIASFRNKIVLVSILVCFVNHTYTFIFPLSLTRHLASVTKALGSSNFIKNIDSKLSQINSSAELGSKPASQLYQNLWLEACEEIKCHKKIPLRITTKSDTLWATKADAVYINEDACHTLSYGAKRLICYELAVLTKYHDDALIHTAQVGIIPIASIAGYKLFKQLISCSTIQILTASAVSILISTLTYDYLQETHNILIFDAAKAVKCYICLEEVNNDNLGRVKNKLRLENSICRYHLLK